MKLVDYKSDSEEENWSECPQEFFEEEGVAWSLSQKCGSKRKIMSAELALHREVAYVMKVAKLQPQHYTDEKNHVAFAQAQYSKHNVTIDGAKSQTENPSGESPAPERQLHTEQNLQIHPSESPPCLPLLWLRQTDAERSPENWSQLQNPFLKKTPKTQQECEVLSAFFLKQQYRGKNHMAKLLEWKMQTKGKDTKPKTLWCDLCNVSCMNEHCFREHLRGKKHAACVEAIKCCSARNNI